MELSLGQLKIPQKRVTIAIWGITEYWPNEDAFEFKCNYSDCDSYLKLPKATCVCFVSYVVSRLSLADGPYYPLE